MMASTARTRESPLRTLLTGRPEAAGSRVYQWFSGPSRGFLLPHWARGERLTRPVEVVPAAHADLVVQCHDVAALLAPTPQLLPLPAVQQRRKGSQRRQSEADQEPDPERAALDPADHPGREAEEEHEDEELEPAHRRSEETVDSPKDRDHG